MSSSMKTRMVCRCGRVGKCVQHSCLPAWRGWPSWTSQQKHRIDLSEYCYCMYHMTVLLINRSDLRSHVCCRASLKANHFIFNSQNRIKALRHLLAILKTILLLGRDRPQTTSAIHRLARAHRKEKIEAIYFKHMKGNIYIFKNNKTEQHFIQKSGFCHLQR